MKMLLVDLNKCNGCYNCQIACKDEHCGNDWSPIAKSQPVSGQFWCKVNERERGKVPVVKVAYTPRFCGHCETCKLLEAAPECVYRNEEGFVIIDPEKAAGRKDLVDLCPEKMVYWNDGLKIPQKCTGCTHLLENGWSQPRCVDACATGALRFGDVEDFAGGMEGAEHLPDQVEDSHVYYLGVPKRMVAGTVADCSKNEVVIGAKVVVKSKRRPFELTLETDEFGDFRCEDLNSDEYSISIQADGYTPVALQADCREDDAVFDDIILQLQ